MVRIELKWLNIINNIFIIYNFRLNFNSKHNNFFNKNIPDSKIFENQ